MSTSLLIQFLGAAQTVTGSRTLVRFQDKKYLVDCGLFQGSKELRLRNWEKFEIANQIEAVFLSHAHIDHSGYLPKLVSDGFRGRIYCSEATFELAKIMLIDSAKLQEEDANYANLTKHSRHDPALPLYTVEDAEKCLELFYALPVLQWQTLTPGLSFRLIRSGHILGSTFVQFNIENQNGSKLLTFSGDLGSWRSEVLQPPDDLKETDFLVLEATYGDRSHPRAGTIEELEKIVNKVISRGGTLVIPAFSVGRTQEIIYLLRQLDIRKKIPKFPVYLDSPMATKVTHLYKKFSEELKLHLRTQQDANGNSVDQIENALEFTHFVATKSTDESMLLCMSTEPKVVISAGGMLTGGRVLHHLKAKLPSEKNGVLFVGYQAEGTKGNLIKNGLRKIRLHHKDVEINAEIFSIESLSAHADSDELVGWVSRMQKKPALTFLNHGESSGLITLKYRLENELSLKTEIAEWQKEYILK